MKFNFKYRVEGFKTKQPLFVALTAPNEDAAVAEAVRQINKKFSGEVGLNKSVDITISQNKFHSFFTYQEKD
jgi:hypothetical protein